MGEGSRVVSGAEPSSLTLERSRRAVSQARSFVHDCCLHAGVYETLCDTAILLVSEVVTNAVEHARSGVDVSVLVDEHAVHVEVHDGTASLPAVRQADPGAVHGRGMTIVDSLSSGWGVRPAERGKVVWFELARQHPPAATPPRARDRSSSRRTGHTSRS